MRAPSGGYPQGYKSSLTPGAAETLALVQQQQMTIPEKHTHASPLEIMELGLTDEAELGCA